MAPSCHPSELLLQGQKNWKRARRLGVIRNRRESKLLGIHIYIVNCPSFGEIRRIILEQTSMSML
jgi:hypothetical protein